MSIGKTGPIVVSGIVEDSTTVPSLPGENKPISLDSIGRLRAVLSAEINPGSEFFFADTNPYGEFNESDILEKNSFPLGRG